MGNGQITGATLQEFFEIIMEKHKPVSFQAITCKKLQITYPTYSCIYYGEILLKPASLHYLKTIYRSSCLSDVGSW